MKLPEVQMTGLAIAGVDFLVVHPARAKNCTDQREGI